MITPCVDAYPLVWTQAHSTWQYPFSLKLCYSCASGVAMGSNILFDKNPPSSPGCTADGVTAETTINNLRNWDFKPSLQLQSASERQHCTSWLSPLIFSLVINTSGNNSSMWLYKGGVARGAMTVNSPTTLGSFSWITHLMKSSSCAQKLFHTLEQEEWRSSTF